MSQIFYYCFEMLIPIMIVFDNTSFVTNIFLHYKHSMETILDISSFFLFWTTDISNSKL